MHAAIVLLCVFAVAQQPALVAADVAASAPAAGVDDWTSADISEFFKKEAGVEVMPGTIEKVGLTPTDLFDGLVDEVRQALTGNTRRAASTVTIDTAATTWRTVSTA